MRALVRTGEFSERSAEDWIATCLIERRNKIGRAFFAQVLPLDRFEVRENKLVFEDLAVKHGLIASREYKIQWSRFDNNSEQRTPLRGEAGFSLPAETATAAVGDYFAAEIAGPDLKKTVTVYLRKLPHEFQVVGIDRGW